jgi:acetyl-CoA C-acetyltransferase
VDLWEVNEAFAVVPMALMQELKVSHDNRQRQRRRLCAGSPDWRQSGARIMVTLMYALKARGLKKGLPRLCIGGGEATAVAH